MKTTLNHIIRVLMILCVFAGGMTSCHRSQERRIRVMLYIDPLGRGSEPRLSAFRDFDEVFSDTTKYDIRREGYSSMMVKSDSEYLCLIDSARVYMRAKEGFEPDVIILSGDYPVRAFSEAEDSLRRNIPTLYMNVATPELIPMLKKRENMVGRWNTMDVRKNLDFIRATGGSSMVLTCLEHTPQDSLMRQLCRKQLTDTVLYRWNEDYSYPIKFIPPEVRVVTEKTWFVPMSILEPESNINPNGDQWSYDRGFQWDCQGNHTTFLQMLNNESANNSFRYSLYRFYTMAPNQFNLPSSSYQSTCIGGYFTPYKVMFGEMRQLVDSIAMGYKPSQLTSRVIDADYWIDWRDYKEYEGQLATDLPEGIRFVNLPWQDRNAFCYWLYKKGWWQIGLLLFVMLVIVAFWLYSRRVRQERKVSETKRLADDNNIFVTKALSVSGSFLWRMKDEIIYVDEEFKVKLKMQNAELPLLQFLRLIEDPAMRVKVSNALLVKHAQQPSQTLQLPIKMFNGDHHTLLVHVGYLPLDGVLTPMGTCQVIDDIVSQQEEIRASLEKEHRVQQREKFFANLGEEISGPLNTIIEHAHDIAEQRDQLSAEALAEKEQDIEQQQSKVLALFDQLLRYSKVLVLGLMTILLSACAAHEEKEYRILAMWPLAADDPVYEVWKPQLEDSLRSHGLNAEIEHYHMNYYKSSQGDAANFRMIDSLFARLDHENRRPDLVLLYGDEPTYNISFSRKWHQMELPFIFYGTYFPYLRDSISHHQNMTGFYDKNELVPNLDFARRIRRDTMQLLTIQLDDHLLLDHLFIPEFDSALKSIDTTRYTNNILRDITKAQIYYSRDQRRPIIMALNLMQPLRNWRNEATGDGYSSDGIFTRFNRSNVTMQVKYDPDCYSKLVHVPVPPFFSSRAEHFATNDSCIGGYFVPYEAMLHDVAGYAEAILKDRVKPSDLPISRHTGKGYYAHYTPLRNHGWDIETLPDDIQVTDLNFRNRYPQLYQWAVILGYFLLAIFVVIVVILAVRELVRRRKMMNDSQKMAESMLLTHQSNRLVLEHLQASIWRIEGETVLIEHSLMPNSYQQSYSLSIDQVIEGAMDYYRGQMREILRTNKLGNYQMEVQVALAEGEYRWLELHMEARETENGLEKIGSFVDIEEEKQQEAELLQAHQRMIATQERDSFIEEMDQSMRQPLKAIVKLSEQLVAQGNSMSEEDIKNLSEHVEKHNQELQQLIEQMLTLAHLRYADVQLNLVPITLKELSYRWKGIYDKKVKQAGQVLRIFTTEDESIIYVDENVVKIVSDTVVDNAIKFNKPGGTVSFAAGVRDGRPYVEVSDTGIGMTPEQQAMVLKPFYKADPATPGLGLGLSLAYEYIRHAGCHFELTSELGVGSTFTLYYDNEKK